MSGPVDVLEVMKADAVHADAYRIAHGLIGSTPEQMMRDSVAAQDAMASLIEVATSALYDMREVRVRRCISPEMVGLDEQIEESIGRLAVALARVGGSE